MKTISSEQIRQRFEKLQNETEKSGHKVDIIAVTKTHPSSIWRNCVEAGITHIGENRVQELVQKGDHEPDSRLKLIVHLIGSLQSNKIKYLNTRVDTIDTLHSTTLAEALIHRNDMINPLPLLLQLNTTDEESKSGIHFNKFEEITRLAKYILQSKKLLLQGVMTIGPTPQGENEINSVEYQKKTAHSFSLARQIRDRLSREIGIKLPRLSMGMSHDYKIAIEEGSTEIRVGSLLFGQR